MKTEEQIRAEFEREYTKNAGPKEAKRALVRNDTGQYILMATSNAWQWWQACQHRNDIIIQYMHENAQSMHETNRVLIERVMQLEARIKELEDTYINLEYD